MPGWNLTPSFPLYIASLLFSWPSPREAQYPIHSIALHDGCAVWGMGCPGGRGVVSGLNRILYQTHLYLHKEEACLLGRESSAIHFLWLQQKQSQLKTNVVINAYCGWESIGATLRFYIHVNRILTESNKSLKQQGLIAFSEWSGSLVGMLVYSVSMFISIKRSWCLTMILDHVGIFYNFTTSDTTRPWYHHHRYATGLCA